MNQTIGSIIALDNKPPTVKPILQTVKVDTSLLTAKFKLLQKIGDALIVDITSNLLSESRLNQLIPAIKAGMSAEELGEILGLEILRAFESACISETLQALEVSVSGNKVICK